MSEYLLQSLRVNSDEIQHHIWKHF